MDNINNQPNNPQPIASNPVLPPQGLSQNGAAALSYVLGFLTGLFFYLTRKEPYVKFHAMQSIIVSVSLMLISYLLGLIPPVGAWLSPLVGIASLILVIYLIIKAYNGEKYKLPYIGDLAEKHS